MSEVHVVDPDLFRTPVRKSTVDTVIDRIKDLLISQKLKPGDRLPNEMDLTKSLSASRGSIREAMKVLSSFGVLEIRRGDGTYVSDSTGQKVFDHLLFQVLLTRIDKSQLLQLRRLLELGIAQIIIKSASDEQIGRIRKVHDRMGHSLDRNEKDPGLLTELDLDFHRAFAEATGNVLIERIYGFTLELFEPSIRRTHENETRLAYTLHTNILEGLAARDEERASEAILRSIEQWNALSD